MSRPRSWHAVACGMGVGVPLLAALGAVVGWQGWLDVPGIRPGERAGVYALLAGFGTFLIAGVTYIVWFAVEAARLDLADDELLPGEQRQPGGLRSATHQHRSWPQKLQGASGGKLFVTNRRLVFRCHGGHPWPYTLELPLERVDDVIPEGGFIGAVRVVLDDGTEERFTVGPSGKPGEFAEQILDLRDAAG